MVTLNKPAAGDVNWTTPINDNWTAIQNFINERRHKRQWVLQQDAGLTSINASGFVTLPTVEGSVVAANDYTGAYLNYGTGAVLNADAGWLSSAFTQTQIRHKPIWTLAMRLASFLTTARFWLGWFSGDPMASATPALSYVAFRYDTTVDGTTWHAVADNASGSPTVVDTGVTAAADTRAIMQIDASDYTSVKFLIDNVLVATITSTLPGDLTNLGHVEQVRALAAADRKLYISRLSVEQT